MSPQSPRRPRIDGPADEQKPQEAMSMARALLLKQSAAAALFGLDMFEANMRVWRSALDAVREASRVQQDALLENVRAQLRTGEPLDEVSKEGAALLAPLLAARRAYEQIGDAVLLAQRQALDKIAEDTRPH